MTTEDVYGLQVRQEGGMSKLARQLLRVHLIFMVIYGLSGVIQIIRALSGQGSKVEAHAAPSMPATRSPTDNMGSMEVFWDMGMMAAAIGLYFLLRQGIQTDNVQMISGLMYCDGCCVGCNCFIGFCGLVGVATMFGVKSYYEEEDTCACQGAVKDELSCAHPCSGCFDRARCYEEVGAFQESFGGDVAMMSFWSILTCFEMCLCLFAALQLSTARSKMNFEPFCRAAAPISIISTVVVGQPITGVGQPVQGQVVVTGPTKSV